MTKIRRSNLPVFVVVEVVNLEMVLVKHLNGAFLDRLEESEVSVLGLPFSTVVFKSTIFYNLRPHGCNLVALYLKFLSYTSAGTGSEAGPDTLPLDLYRVAGYL